MAAAVAVAGLVGRASIARVFGAADIHFAGRREKRPIARVPSGQYAIEEIVSGRHRRDQILGAADSHEVAGAVLRQQSRRVGADRAQRRLSFADSKTASGESVERQRRELARAFAPEAS